MVPHTPIISHILGGCHELIMKGLEEEATCHVLPDVVFEFLPEFSFWPNRKLYVIAKHIYFICHEFH